MVGRHAEQGRPKARCAVEESFVRRMALGTLWTSRKSSVATATGEGRLWIMRGDGRYVSSLSSFSLVGVGLDPSVHVL